MCSTRLWNRGHVYAASWYGSMKVFSRIWVLSGSPLIGTVLVEVNFLYGAGVMVACYGVALVILCGATQVGGQPFLSHAAIIFRDVYHEGKPCDIFSGDDLFRHLHVFGEATVWWSSFFVGFFLKVGEGPGHVDHARNNINIIITSWVIASARPFWNSHASTSGQERKTSRACFHKGDSRTSVQERLG